MESVRLIRIIFSTGNYFIYHKLLTLSPLCLYIYKLQTNLQNAIVIVAQGVPLESWNTKFEGTTACCFPTNLYKLTGEVNSTRVKMPLNLYSISNVGLFMSPSSSCNRCRPRRH